MDSSAKKIISVFVVVLLFGGFGALIKFCAGFAQVLFAFFPIFGRVIVENYFSSAYFWTGLIIAILSACGIWIGAKGGKKLFLVISIIALAISILSIGSHML